MTMTTKQINGLPVAFRQAAAPEERGWSGLDESSCVLKAGTVRHPGAQPLPCDVLLEQDVPVTLRDGTVIRTDVYRPTDRTGCPAIVGWGPYGKRHSILTTDTFNHPTRMDVPLDREDGFNKFEGPNPADWVVHGYAVVAPDSRGVFGSGGDLHAWGDQEARDGHDLIEWIAAQPWSNGKVGLTGNSWLAMAQWFIAATRPPHLAAIAPWEGASDVYRDTAMRGGMPDPFFTEGIFSRFRGQGLVEDLPAMMRAHPDFDAYWAGKSADLGRIEAPAYVVASWTNVMHTGGTLRAWSQIGSPEKWLRVHNTHEWTDYYDPRHVEDLRRFFDTYLRGQDNGWQATPRVRLATLDPGHVDTVDRAEAAFPLSRQRAVALYLDRQDGQGVLRRETPHASQALSYDSADPDGVTFRLDLDRCTELTGYFKLRLWVSAASHDDLDLFACIRKRDAQGRVRDVEVVTGGNHPGPHGRLRVSRRALDSARSTPLQPRHLDDRTEKIAPGEIVPVDIAFWPYSLRWQAGETLELQVTGVDPIARPEFSRMPRTPTLNQGRHVLHFGGQHDAQLVVPAIEGL